MSAIGTKRTSASAVQMSAFGGKADLRCTARFAGKANDRKPYQSGPYTPIMGPIGRKLLFRPSTGE